MRPSSSNRFITASHDSIRCRKITVIMQSLWTFVFCVLFFTLRCNTHGRHRRMKSHSLSSHRLNDDFLHTRRKRQDELYNERKFLELLGPRRSEPFCAGRIDSKTGGFSPCCVGRDDSCKLTLRGRVCYCDQFCNRIGSSDCCPDHEEFCGSTWFHRSNIHTTTEKSTRGKTSTSTRGTTASLTTHSPITADNSTKPKTSATLATTTILTTQSPTIAEKSTREKTSTSTRGTTTTLAAQSPTIAEKSSKRTTSTFTSQVTTSASTKSPTPTIAESVDEASKVCYDNGIGYRLGEKIKRNCHKCICKRASNAYYSFVCGKSLCLVESAMIQVINTGQYGWTASNYSFFWGLTRGQGVRHRLGTKRAPKVVRNMTAISQQSDVILPEQFDARDRWQGLIQPPKDQGKCGSSWAFSTTSVASDRLAIQSRGRVTLDLSTQQLLSCRYRRAKKKKCRKKRIDKAWWMLRRSGLVSSNCYPLTATQDGKIQSCRYLKRISKCANHSIKPTLYRMAPQYRIASNEKDIMTEIYLNGPVQAEMEVTQDFFLYKTGVYNLLPKQVTGKKSGKKYFHSVKIVGWGIRKDFLVGPIKYWLVQNSWGTEWGEDGYFRISRGENANEIESYVVGVWANIKMEV